MEKSTGAAKLTGKNVCFFFLFNEKRREGAKNTHTEDKRDKKESKLNYI